MSTQSIDELEELLRPEVSEKFMRRWKHLFFRGTTKILALLDSYDVRPAGGELSLDENKLTAPLSALFEYNFETFLNLTLRSHEIACLVLSGKLGGDVEHFTVVKDPVYTLSANPNWPKDFKQHARKGRTDVTRAHYGLERLNDKIDIVDYLCDTWQIWRGEKSKDSPYAHHVMAYMKVLKAVHTADTQAKLTFATDRISTFVLLSGNSKTARRLNFGTGKRNLYDVLTRPASGIPTRAQISESIQRLDVAVKAFKSDTTLHKQRDLIKEILPEVECNLTCLMLLQHRCKATLFEHLRWLSSAAQVVEAKDEPNWAEDVPDRALSPALPSVRDSHTVQAAEGQADPLGGPDTNFDGQNREDEEQRQIDSAGERERDFTTGFAKSTLKYLSLVTQLKHGIVQATRFDAANKTPKQRQKSAQVNGAQVSVVELRAETSDDEKYSINHCLELFGQLDVQETGKSRLDLDVIRKILSEENEKVPANCNRKELEVGLLSKTNGFGGVPHAESITMALIANLQDKEVLDKMIDGFAVDRLGNSFAVNGQVLEFLHDWLPLVHVTKRCCPACFKFLQLFEEYTAKEAGKKLKLAAPGYHNFRTQTTLPSWTPRELAEGVLSFATTEARNKLYNLQRNYELYGKVTSHSSQLSPQQSDAADQLDSMSLTTVPDSVCEPSGGSSTPGQESPLPLLRPRPSMPPPSGTPVPSPSESRSLQVPGSRPLQGQSMPSSPPPRASFFTRPVSPLVGLAAPGFMGASSPSRSPFGSLPIRPGPQSSSDDIVSMPSSPPVAIRVSDDSEQPGESHQQAEMGGTASPNVGSRTDSPSKHPRTASSAYDAEHEERRKRRDEKDHNDDVD
ncbi:hypothetical protein Slin15195_G109000 [Septoria linicola]|uniref:Uncharacterized protein n=1 Tax=Septoria linicola TaxID=215465 RepID=A0A9Q9B744_9PEZI|nr:hypothetical protein Slin15195_G109000 [Septoria linicola]